MMGRYALEYYCEDCGARGFARGTRFEVYAQKEAFEQEHRAKGHRMFSLVEYHEKDYLREHPDALR
jgi:hypothetical protein